MQQMKSHALERVTAQRLLVAHNSPNVEHVSASDLEGSGRSDTIGQFHSASRWSAQAQSVWERQYDILEGSERPTMSRTKVSPRRGLHIWVDVNNDGIDASIG